MKKILFKYNDWITNRKVYETTKVALSELDNPEYQNFKNVGDSPKSDQVNKNLLDDINKAAQIANVRVLVTSAVSDHAGASVGMSRHDRGEALDLARIGKITTNFNSLPGNPGATAQKPVVNAEYVECADALVDALIGMGYKLITQDSELKSKYSASIVQSESNQEKVIIWKFSSDNVGNHYNHVHVSNSSSTISQPNTQIENTEQVYKSPDDPYEYCVINGIWYSRKGPEDKKGTWEYFEDWKSLEKNCKSIEILDQRYNGARKSEEIESNRQKFCSYPDDIEKNRQEWFKEVGADDETAKLGLNEKSNNNPGNVRYNSEYAGCIGNQKGFCKFSSINFGYKAILTTLTTYYRKYNLDTIREILNRYAPPVENDTQHYVDFISSKSKIGADTHLEEQDLIKLIPGMVKMESGIDISLDEVRKMIQQSEATDETAKNSVVFNGDESQIYLPIGFQGELPTTIFYPMGENKELIKNLITQELNSLMSDNSFVFPNEYDTNWSDLKSDIEDCFDDNEVELKDITVVTYGESSKSKVIRDFEDNEKVKRILIINPEPSNNFLGVVEKLLTTSKIYIVMNSNEMENKFDKEKLTKFIVELKTLIRKSGKNPNEYYMEFNDLTNIDLIRKALKIIITSPII